MPELPPIYLLNLDRSTDRLQRFKEWNSHLRNVTRVSAIDGGAVDREALIRSGYIARDLPYAAGTLGSALSHLKLWEMAASEGKDITVFEDAVVVSDEFEKRAGKILSEVPSDWDLIKWGVLFNPKFVWLDLGVSRARLEPYGGRRYASAADYTEFQRARGATAAVRLMHSFGIMGYSISAKGAHAALRYCLPLRERLISFPDADVVTEDLAIDIALAGLYPDLKAYLCIPQLVIRRSDEQSVREAVDAETG